MNTTTENERKESPKRAVLRLPCGCERREGTYPAGSLCDVGEGLLDVKNRAAIEDGEIARGERDGDPRIAALTAWAAQHAFLEHVEAPSHHYMKLPAAPGLTLLPGTEAVIVLTNILELEAAGAARGAARLIACEIARDSSRCPAIPEGIGFRIVEETHETILAGQICPHCGSYHDVRKKGGQLTCGTCHRRFEPLSIDEIKTLATRISTHEAERHARVVEQQLKTHVPVPRHRTAPRVARTPPPPATVTTKSEKAAPAAPKQVTIRRVSWIQPWKDVLIEIASRTHRHPSRLHRRYLQKWRAEPSGDHAFVVRGPQGGLIDGPHKVDWDKFPLKAPPPKKAKGKWLQIRVTDEEHERIAEAADAIGESISDMVRRLALREAEKKA